MAGFAAAALLLLGTVWASPASGQDGVACGDEISEDTKLTHDVGPCDGPGLFVVADGVTLDLGGHTVSGDPFLRAEADEDKAADDAPGVVLRNVSGSTVENGTVTGFDAGVVIRGGGDNVVRNVTAEDNINYRVVTGIDAVHENPDTEPRPEPCVFGDGIATFNSNGNRIEHNTVAHNGPLSGIALVLESNDNVVSNNKVLDNDIQNLVMDGSGDRTICGTNSTQGPMTAGRQVQSVGIRVEGPNAHGNKVEGNQVKRSGLAGIAVHGYVCESPNEEVPVFGNNGENEIVKNTVMLTGLRTHDVDSHAHGIAALQQGPASIVCVAHSNTFAGNNSSQNFADGIFLGGRGTHDNVVNDNVVNHNEGHGVRVTGPSGDVPGAVNNELVGNRGHRNGEFDGADYNPDCDNNDWWRNRFGTVNQPCVADGGTGSQSGPGKSAEAPGQEREAGPLGNRGDLDG